MFNEDLDRKAIIFKLVAAAKLLMVAAVLAFFNLYALFLNETNHTGFDPKIFIYFFTFWIIIDISLVVAVFLGKLPKGSTFHIISSALIAVIGILNVMHFMELGVILGYEEWVARGMPEKPALDSIF